MDLSVQDLEAAINFWRSQRPARGNEFALSPEVNVLARIYALMIFHRTPNLPADKLDARARQLLQTWREADNQAKNPCPHLKTRSAPAVN